jgi:single-stranded DNA-binding protein
MTIEVALFGSLSRDADVKISKAGKRFLRLNARTGNDEGSQWVSILCFDETAVSMSDRFTSGARIYCEGSLKSEEWVDKSGAKRFGLTVLSWHCRLSAIGRNRQKRKTDGGPSATSSTDESAPASTYELDDPIPF